MKLRLMFKRRDAVWFLIPIILLPIVFYFSFVLAAKFSFGSVREIICRTQYGSCPNDLEMLLSDIRGKNIFLLTKNDFSKVQESQVKDFQFSTRLPSTLLVDLTLRKARVAVRGGEGDFLLLDLDGELVGKVGETVLPVLALSEQTDRNNLRKAIKILSLVKNSGSEIESSRLVDNTLFLNSRGFEIILPIDKSAEILVGSLQFILGKFTIDGRRIVKIDFRFNNPVVTFK